MADIKEMAGQRLMLGFDGMELNQDLKHIIGNIKACGIILFKRNIKSPEQLAALCADCQAYARSKSVPPLFIAVDQEGGSVARLREPFTQFKGNPFIESLRDAEEFACITAEELKQVGINMNFAPVLDVAPVMEDGLESIMKDRVFKGDAKKVSSLGNKVIHTFQENQIMAVAKHFPGIGRTCRDSHFHLPVLDIDLEIFMQSDMIPFADAKKEGVSGMMLSHIMYPRLDKDWQASLSPVIVNDILREKMGYEGLVMTDDLDMKAIRHDMKTCVRQILKSGVDMALICHKGPDIDIAFNEIVQQTKGDATLFHMAEKSIKRIMKFKKKYLAEKGA